MRGRLFCDPPALPLCGKYYKSTPRPLCLWGLCGGCCRVPGLGTSRSRTFQWWLPSPTEHDRKLVLRCTGALGDALRPSAGVLEPWREAVWARCPISTVGLVGFLWPPRCLLVVTCRGAAGAAPLALCGAQGGGQKNPRLTPEADSKPNFQRAEPAARRKPPVAHEAHRIGLPVDPGHKRQVCASCCVCVYGYAAAGF